jgi:hypothetical protein
MPLSRYDFVALRARRRPIAAEIADPLKSFRLDKTTTRNEPLKRSETVYRLRVFSRRSRAGQLEPMPDRMKSRLRIAGHHDCSTCSTPGETPAPGC